jgi:hypothetical protein
MVSSVGASPRARRTTRAGSQTLWDISAPIQPLRASVKMRPMTEARSVAHWSGVPRFSQPLLEALLRLVAMLWSNVAQLSRMNPSRRHGECHTSAMPQALPETKSDNQEIKPASARSDHSVLHRAAGEVACAILGARRRGKPHEDSLHPHPPRRRGPSPLQERPRGSPTTLRQRAPHACLDPRLRGEHGR